MISLKNLVIDAPATIGKDIKLVGISPSYAYEGEKKTDTVEAFKLEVLCPALGYEKLTVKVEGATPLIPEDEWVAGSALPIFFDGLEIKAWQDFHTKQIRVSASAKSARLLQVQKG
ncbi:hypothetical protein [Caproiciproducens sp. LBM24188]